MNTKVLKLIIRSIEICQIALIVTLNISKLIVGHIDILNFVRNTIYGGKLVSLSFQCCHACGRKIQGSYLIARNIEGRQRREVIQRELLDYILGCVDRGQAGKPLETVNSLDALVAEIDLSNSLRLSLADLSVLICVSHSDEI